MGIAAEFAGYILSLGSQVKVLCRGSFLRNLDGEIKKYVLEHLLRDVEIQENVQVNEITGEGAITSNGKVDGPVFLATGMTPNSEIAKNLVESDPGV